MSNAPCSNPGLSAWRRSHIAWRATTTCGSAQPSRPWRRHADPQAPARALKSGFACQPVLRCGFEYWQILRFGTERPLDGTVLRKRVVARDGPRQLILKSGFERGVVLRCGTGQGRCSEAHLSSEKDVREERARRTCRRAGRPRVNVHKRCVVLLGFPFVEKGRIMFPCVSG